MRNRMAIETLALRPRVLRKLTQIDLGATVFGLPLSLPLILAPIGGLESFDPAGAASASAGAAAAGVMMCLSSACKPGPAETAAAAPAGSPKIFQLYVRGDRDFITANVEKAIETGYQVFCLTVDTQLYSRRERDFLNRFSKPWRAAADDAANNQAASQAALDWDDVEWFKKTWPDLPLVLKGIATGEDAALALELGVDGVWVSNHGGRQLDAGVGSLDVLPEVVEAVGGRATVIVDGGFSRGTDIVKAMALGADCVAIGRLTGIALAAAGTDGLIRALDLLAEEMWIALGLCGVTSFAALTPKHVREVAPLGAAPHVFSAFPHLEKSIAEYLLRSMCNDAQFAPDF